MKRPTRAQLAQETVEIVRRGVYQSPDGRTVHIADSVRACLAATRFFPPEDLNRLRRNVLGQPCEEGTAKIEVVNETTLSGIARLVSAGEGPVAALNFASARNPGGGFLKGSQAQEESLARSSALYASLLRGKEYYDRHRAEQSGLYTDAMIFSPECPIFRDDDGALLGEPMRAAFLTSPAPNAGATAKYQPRELARLPDVFRRRSELVLALAAAHGYRNLVLGAWGCGVFRNDPEVVAAAFASHLRHGLWVNRFRRVVFSVLDTSDEQGTFTAFERALAQPA